MIGKLSLAAAVVGVLVLGTPTVGSAAALPNAGAAKLSEAGKVTEVKHRRHWRKSRRHRRYGRRHYSPYYYSYYGPSYYVYRPYRYRHYRRHRHPTFGIYFSF